MSHQLNLASIDVDGAVRETAAEAMVALDGDTRSQFLRRAGIAGGAVVGGGALLGALAPSAMAFSTGTRPPASFGKRDIGILNYALTLEYPSQAKFLKAAFTFENEGVHAYSGQAFNIKDPKVLAAALSIVTIEARHASVVGLILKGTESCISPNGAFDTPFGASKVLKDVTSLHYIKG
jgi:hypothetical protein